MNNETLADIMAGMRDPENDYITNNDLRDLADRIEAAAKRERGALVAEAEAAKDARNRALVRLREEYAERCHECKTKSGNAAAMRLCDELIQAAYDADICSPGDLAQRVRKIKAALPAPLRNCDRFRTADEVSAYWGANVHAVPLHGDAYAMRIDGETYPTFLDWLMAPAKEGGAE